MSDIPAPPPTGTETVKRRKHRSPSYPAFDLEVAVQRAKVIWDVANRHSINVGTAIESWGYSPKSSTGKLLIATLKKFGMLRDEGGGSTRKVELTELGRRLAVHDRGSEAWKLAAREAVFMPDIHLELWSKYDGALPSDPVVTPSLVLERGFSTQAAVDLLAEFRASLDYAGISQADDGRGELSNADSDYDIQERGDEALPIPEREAVAYDRGADVLVRRADGRQFVVQAKADPPQRAAVRREQPYGGMPEGHRAVSIPYSPGQWAVLQAPFPITDADFSAMVSMLQAMKPGLVAPPEGHGSSDASEPVRLSHVDLSDSDLVHGH